MPSHIIWHSFLTHLSKAFRAGLLQGDPNTVHPLLAWCLTRLDELKKRAFVGKFLVPLDIPPEYIQSPQASDAYSQVCEVEGLDEVVTWAV